MERHMRLIFLVLDYAAREITRGAVPVPEFDGYTDEQVHYHVGLCVQAKYLVAQSRGQQRVDGLGRFKGLIGLTWQGHEELDNLRPQYG